MARRRPIRGALAGFLGTFTSRNSDHHGYWLLGQLPDSVLTEGVFDLRNPCHGICVVTTVARELAATRFEEQVVKAGLRMAVVQSARLRIHAIGQDIECWQGDHRSKGDEQLANGDRRTALRMSQATSGPIEQLWCARSPRDEFPTADADQWTPLIPVDVSKLQVLEQEVRVRPMPPIVEMQSRSGLVVFRGQ